MRLAYLCADFGIPVYGAKGAAIHVREMATALHRHVGVQIFTPRTGGDRPAGFPVPVHHVPLPAVDHALYDALRDDERGGTDVAREVRAMLYATVLRHVVASTMRPRPDAIYERYALFGTAGVALARELDIPLILEVNAPLADEQAAHRGLSFSQAARTTEQSTLRQADRVVAVSTTLRDWLVDSGVDPARIDVLPNGVDAARFAPIASTRERMRADLNIGADECVVGFVGTLKAWHGTATLLAAVALLRSLAPRLPIRLLIVGEGPERVLLQSLAATSGIADVTHFTGAVPHADVPAYVGAMDIAVAPYDQVGRFYFSPLKVFEYMAAGRPVVAAGVGQLAECLRHGETALLYPPGDLAALTSALRSLAESPRERVRLGIAAHSWVETHHSWAGNARRVVELIDNARGVTRDVRGVA